MSPFWTSLFVHLRDCGRNATLFLVTLGAMIVLLLLLLVIWVNDLHKYLIPALPLAAGFAVIWAAVAIRRFRARHRGRWRCSPLSNDELRAARLRLIKARVDREGASGSASPP